MRKVIDGVVYDTAKATRIAHHSHFISPLAKYRTTLYQGEAGKWFTVHEKCGAILGLPKSDSQFAPISESDAYERLHQWNEVDLLKRYFPDKITDA